MLKPTRRSLLQALGLSPIVAVAAKASQAQPAQRQTTPAPAPAESPAEWIGVDCGPGVKRWIPMFVIALLLGLAGGAGGACSSPAAASTAAAAAPVAIAIAPTSTSGAEIVALARVNDAGQLVRAFNVADVERTGPDGNFSVRVTLGPVPALERLYPLASLSDARVGFTVDLTQTIGGPILVDLAVEADHTSGFYLAIVAAP
jgi:hypothetical protein